VDSPGGGDGVVHGDRDACWVTEHGLQIRASGINSSFMFPEEILRKEDPPHPPAADCPSLEGRGAEIWFQIKLFYCNPPLSEERVATGLADFRA